MNFRTAVNLAAMSRMASSRDELPDTGVGVGNPLSGMLQSEVGLEEVC